MIVSAIVIVAYTALGGFSAASTTDLIQSIVMSFALICVVLFGVKTAGGTDVILSQAAGTSGVSVDDADLYERRSDRVWRDQDCVYACMGAWLFWNAAYFASVYGDRR